MRKILLGIIGVLLISTVSIFMSPKISAQESGITLYPAFVELSPGNSYTITVQNNTESVQEMDVNPEIFSLNSDSETVEPLPESLFETLGINLGEYLNVSPSSLSIQPGESAEIEVEYAKQLEKYVLGVKLEQTGEGDQNVSIGYNLGSIILDIALTEEDLEKINQNIDIKSSFKIGNFYFGKNFQIEYKLSNNTTKILKAFGELQIKDENTRLEQYSLTTDLQNTIYPSKEVYIQKSFSDNRSFSERLGSLNLESYINVNGRELEYSKNIYVLPIELLLIIILILPSLILVGFMYKKRSRILLKGPRGKSKKITPSGTRMLGQRKK